MVYVVFNVISRFFWVRRNDGFCQSTYPSQLLSLKYQTNKNKREWNRRLTNNWSDDYKT